MKSLAEATMPKETFNMLGTKREFENSQNPFNDPEHNELLDEKLNYLQ